MVTISEAMKLLEAGFTVEDIRNMDKAPAEQKQEPKQEQKQEQKQEKPADPYAERFEALTGIVEKLVDTVGKLPFSFSMGESAQPDTDAILASIINPPKKEDK